MLTLAVIRMPFPDAELDARFPESQRIRDSRGGLLREVVNRHGARAQWTPLDEISPLVAAATVAVEDERFWQHRGVDGLAAMRAVAQGIAAGRLVSGASTLTMQLTRLLRGHPRNLRGKLAQSFDALRLERVASKQEILEQYLNRAPYGAGTIGVEAASRRIFGKPSRHLSLAEAALLTGLPQGPSRLNPLRHPEAARRRQQKVLSRLLVTGVIGRQEYDRARRQPLRFTSHPPPLAAMHFTDYVLAQDPPPGEVRTTLDGDLQVAVERLVGEHVLALAPGGLTNAAVVVLDNAECAILAMVGSADYWGSQSGSVNGATARRQPGSALKPFTYALAFERGWTPASVAADVETRYLGPHGTLYRPQNYSEEFSGPVLLSEALGRSLNVPAIRLANALGVEDLLERYRAVGLRSLDRPADHYGLGLTLGNGEVTLLELAAGYAMFARGGLTCTPRALADAPAGAPNQVFSREAAFLITDVLSDESLRIRAFGAASPLLVGFPMAIKTGTSSNWRDNWAVGYTRRFTVAVWAGDFAGGTMDHFSGAVGAGPLFHQVARLVVERGAVAPSPSLPEPPPGVEEIVVCALSGLMPTAHCPHRRAVFVPRQDEARASCSWHRAVRIDRRNGLLASDRCPAEFVEEVVFEVLPPPYAAWQADHGSSPPPTHYSPLCPAEGITADALVITSPRRDEVYLLEPGYDRRTQSLRLAGEVHPAVPEVTWIVDGRAVASVSWPYEASWTLARGRHRLEMRGGGKRSDPVEFEVR